MTTSVVLDISYHWCGIGYQIKKVGAVTQFYVVGMRTAK